MKNKSGFVATFICALVLGLTTAQAQNTDSSTNGFRVVGESITGASQLATTNTQVESKLDFACSDAKFVEAFRWAKAQSLAFVFENDPVGPWCEAAEPGREAFCMRDTAHQAMGAHALGLARHNLNMLRKFAEGISDSRDWCSFWEIDRFDRPAPVDYKDDAEFWYNLPANFDVLDCCFRMYVWTGDKTYVNEPAFLNFYKRTVTDYVERWGLGIDQIMKRPRLLNMRGIFDETKKFPKNRGIPGYDEQDHTYVLGFDVLATEHAAYLAYAHVQEVRGDAETAQKYLNKAGEVESLATNTWWNAKENAFYNRLNKDYQLEGTARRSFDWAVVRFDNPDAAYERMTNAAFGPRSRREYPEVPFSWIGDLVNGTMGINLVFTSPLVSAEKGFWVEAMVQTLPGIGSKISWAELRNLPMRANEISIRHEGATKTVFTNQHGPALIWQACFSGAHETLLVNGRPMKAHIETAPREISSVVVTVGPAGTSTVEVSK